MPNLFLREYVLARGSMNVANILLQLLTRDPEKRLGTAGGTEVKNHIWFADIDWDKLVRKEIDPPFKPKVKNVEDTSQIDPTFTRERPVDSVTEQVRVCATFIRVLTVFFAVCFIRISPGQF